MEAGCRYAIIGHSSRRHVFGETSEMVFQKTKAALAAACRHRVIGEATGRPPSRAHRKYLQCQFEEKRGRV